MKTKILTRASCSWSKFGDWQEEISVNLKEFHPFEYNKDLSQEQNVLNHLAAKHDLILTPEDLDFINSDEWYASPLRKWYKKPRFLNDFIKIKPL